MSEWVPESVWLTAAIIVAVNIIYVSLFSLRLILMIKGQRLIASLLVMFEVFVYIAGLAMVLNRLDNPVNIVAYCIGYGLGVYVGSLIEERLALGYLTVQVIVDMLQPGLPQRLRERGFGVTSWIAEGRDGPRTVMQVLVRRKHERKLLALIESLAPKAFIISHEPKHFHGGFWIKRLP